MSNQNKKKTETENNEWLASINWIIENDSKERAQELIDLMVEKSGLKSNGTQREKIITDYINSIPPDEEVSYPGNTEIERKILNALRWNAMAMVVKANKAQNGLGGHISTYASVSTLFEVGFNHFFKGYQSSQPDLIFFQGHASPGIYARSFLEHRLDEKDLEGFRREVQSEQGLTSYPHPKLMPEYWRFPTVSMGLAPVQAIYQARFLKYLENRGLREPLDQHVWVFLGDGEMDEPESTGALAIASRSALANLTFVVSCNLQRLDGPVRGNQKIVNELEGLFKGAGWKVIKVLWNETWQQLLDKDENGALRKKLNEIPDGQLQKWAQLNGKELRSEFFNKDEQLKQLVADMDDDELYELTRGGHDPIKVFNAYKQAVENTEGPTVILAQTIKGYRQGNAGEASNVTHQQKKLDQDQLKAFLDEMQIPVDEEDLEDIPYYRFDKESEAYKYLATRREELAGWLPDRQNLAESFSMPDEQIFKNYVEGSDGKEVTTTSVIIQILGTHKRQRPRRIHRSHCTR